jgi:hypothetical protein
MGCTSTPPHTFMACERKILSQVLVKELVGRNRTDLQYILWRVRGDVNIIIRGTHCYNWVLKKPKNFGLSGFLDTSPSHYPKLFSQNPSNISKVPHTILKPSFSMSQTRHIVLPLRCTIVSNTILMHWACRKFPFCFMTSSINFHFSSNNTDDFSSRE